MILTADTFAERLRTDGAYRTPPEHAPRGADRWLGRRDAWYYLLLAAVVWRGYRRSRKPDFLPRLWMRCAYETLRAAERCGAQVIVEQAGLQAQVGGPAVYTANHMSLLETFLLPALLILPFHDVTVVLKRDLMRYPLFGPILRAVKPIAVGRRDAREDLRTVLHEGAAVLRRGRSIVVFPQATRTAHFDPQRFNSLGAKLAARAGAPLIPVALRTDFHGIGRIVRDAGPVRRDRTVRFRFGAPLDVHGNGRAAHEASVAFIVAALREWGVPVASAPDRI
ncbi:MAG: 1-acyl-sn-glycerol-3-phosphate acyltransferase [Lentisphaerae bacterium]|nr:1-acyl-sn-glycerol-3-phosphate acyltransferase [Lentisphaerota bacterium]